MNKSTTIAYCLSQNNFCGEYVLPGTPSEKETEMGTETMTEARDPLNRTPGSFLGLRHNAEFHPIGCNS